MEQYVLGVDIGSSSVKLTLLSRQGAIAATAGCEYPTYYPQVGWCEQEPEDWCSAFKSAFANLLQRAQVRPKQIKAVAFDAATHTAVLLDKNKKVLRRAILWTDQRSKEEVQKLNESCISTIMSQVLNGPSTVWTLPQMMWLHKHELDIWKQIRYILFAKDYLRYRMTGVMETDTIDASGSMFYDAVQERWSDELCAAGEIPSEWLPALRGPMDMVCAVSGERAEEFGLAEGTKVLVGTTDTVMEVFAAGNTKLGDTTIKLATAGRICVVTEQPLHSGFIFNYRHVIPGLWYPGTGTASCAASYRWYRDVIGRAPFSELDECAQTVGPGSDGLVFQPYLNGELTPYHDPYLKGSYIGISSRHTTAHFARASLEGVAMSLRDCLNLRKSLNVVMKRTRFIGGGAKSALWRQIVADVLELELQKVKVDDSSFGTAMMAAVGVGWFDSLAHAAETCVQIDSVTVPNPANKEIYDEVFGKYKEIHDVLAPIYRRW